MPLFRKVSGAWKRVSQHDAVRLMGSASFVFLCRILGAVTVFATQVLLARWMGPEQLGFYVYAFAWCTILATIAGLGLPTAIFRFVGSGLAQSNNNLIVSFSRFSRYATIVASILIASIGIAIVEGSTSVVPLASRSAFLIALALVPVYALIRWYSSLANALSLFHLAFLPRVVFRPLLLLIVVYFAWLLGFAISSASVMAANMGVMLLVLIPQCGILERSLHRRFANVQPYQYQATHWIRLALPQLVTSLFVNSFFEMNMVIVGIFLPPDELAILNAAFRITLVIAFGIQAIDVITLPGVARIYAAGDAEALQRTVARATRIKFFGALGGTVGLVILGGPILSLFGPEFMVGYEALIILAFSQVFVAGIGMGAQLLNVSGHQDECLRVFVCSAILMVALHWILAPRFGIEGAAIAVVAVVVTQSWWIKTIVERRLNILPAMVSLRSLRRRSCEK